ncbi:hypothetical protein V8G61_11860 [Gaetbulibacter sp. M240]|uniref:hypothetical protein n=1 Tax=Gaetbulibacter sp. M240 TaxID=3126511 RepID=UPI00374F7FC1
MRNLVLFFLIITCTKVVFSQNDIEVTYTRNTNNSVQFNYNKKVPGSYFLTIEFDVLENSNNSMSVERVVKNASGILLTLKPIDERNGISFSYRIKYTQGNPYPKVNKKVSYFLPFQTGRKIKIMEASDLGEKYFGSKKPIGWKSFLVISNTPDTIYAMRRGQVIHIKNEYDKDVKFNKLYTSARNAIIIEHEDGTYALYQGFNKDEIFVKPGQEVYPHTVLGTLEKFNKGNYRFDFNIFHFLNNLLDEKESTLKDRNYKIKFLDPVFFVNNKNVKLQPGEVYNVSINEKLITQEFSNREKKKYQKNPELFE